MPVRTEPAYSTEQIENDLSTLRGAHDALNEYAELTTVVVLGVEVADQPGNTHSLAGDGTPATQETWHAFSPLSNSWSVPSGGYANYRITPNNELQISAWIKSPGSSTVNGVTIATFPVGYRPVSTHGFPVAADLLPASVTASPLMTITSGGVMQATGVGGNPGNANVYIEARIPLDV